jgi:hypothetical protein
MSSSSASSSSSSSPRDSIGTAPFRSLALAFGVASGDNFDVSVGVGGRCFSTEIDRAPDGGAGTEVRNQGNMVHDRGR